MWTLDSAFISRAVLHYVPLPTAPQIYLQLKYIMKESEDVCWKVKKDELRDIASYMYGRNFSCREVSRTMTKAKTKGRNVHFRDQRHFKFVDANKGREMVQCKPEEGEAKEMTLMKLLSLDVKLPKMDIGEKHIMEAVRGINPVIKIFG